MVGLAAAVCGAGETVLSDLSEASMKIVLTTFFFFAAKDFNNAE